MCEKRLLLSFMVYMDVSTGNHNFGLRSTSPYMGVGINVFIREKCSGGSEIGATEITLPGIDIGVCQTNHRGDQY